MAKVTQTGYIEDDNISTPINGIVNLYAKSDGNLYQKNDSGIETQLGVTNSFTNPMTTAGDIIYSTTGGAPLRLGIGNEGEVLSVSSGSPTWTTNRIIDVSTSDSAMRITQRGSGYSLLVEDDTNPDSSPFIIDSNGNVGIGKIPTVPLDVNGNAVISGTLSGSNLSGTNTGDQNLFSTIAISGQSDVVADTTSDTLTLVGGTNVTLTTNSSTDTITINAAGGGAGIIVETPQNTSSGTSSSFTTLPSGLNRITVIMDSVSLSAGSSQILLRLGDNTGYYTTLYEGVNSRLSGSSSETTSVTNGLGVGYKFGGTPPTLFSGTITLVRITGNNWICNGTIVNETNSETIIVSGSRSLSNDLDSLQLIIVSGTANFNGGSWNIFYE